LSCVDSWSKILPPIIGEAEGKKFSVLVDLGDASKFLNYDPYARMFNVTCSSKKIVPGDFGVQLTISDRSGLISVYVLPITITCPV